MPNIMSVHQIFLNLFTILLLQPLVVVTTTKGASSSSALTSSSALVVRQSRHDLDTDAMYTLLIVHPESLSNEDEALKWRMKLAAWHIATDMGDSGKKRAILDAPEITAEFVCHLFIESEKMWMARVENEFNLGEKKLIRVQTKKQKERMDEYNRKANLHYEMADCSQITKSIQMERKLALDPWNVEFLKVVQLKHYAAILELMPTNEWSFEEFWEEFKLHWEMKRKNAPVNQPALRKDKEEITSHVQKAADDSKPASTTSKLVRELRTSILEALCIEDEFERQNELARIKGNILSMVDANNMPAMHMASLEFTHPFTMLIGVNDNELKVAEYVYKELLKKPSKDTHTETFNIRLTLRILCSHIWTAIFDQKRFANIIEDEEGSDEIIEALMEDNLREFFQLAKDLPSYAGAIGQSQMRRAKQLAIELYEFWNNLTGYQMENLERSFDSLREHLLWTDHLEILTRLNEKGGFIDSISDRGEYARLGEFFGGFENIWQNLVVKKAKYSREGKFENDEDLLALFRIDLNENRILKIVRDNMEYILKEKSPSLQNPELNKLRNLLGYKQARWAIDLLVYLGELDAHFDTLGSDHLVNQWWMAKVEVELFVDSLADRKGKEGLEMPATRMLNWMHLLWHRKCTNPQKEDNLRELVEDLHKYIGMCKKAVEKQAMAAPLSGLKNEMRTLRYKNLKEILESVDNDGQHRFNSFYKEFYKYDMNKDGNVKTILEDLVGAKNANEILAMKTYKLGSDVFAPLYLNVLKPEKLVDWKKAEIELLFQFAGNEILNHEKEAREHRKDIASIQARQRTELIANTIARLKKEDHKTGGSDTNKWLDRIRWIKAVDDLSIPLTNYYSNDMFDRIHLISIEQAEHALAKFSGYFENTEYFFAFHQELLPVIEKSEELQNVLKYKIGAVHRLKLILGNSAMGNEEKTGDRLNIQRIWTKIANRRQLDMIRDANYFHNDADLQSHYKEAILSMKKVESLRHSLSADIFVFMRYVEPKFGINRSKSGANKISVNYVEQLKLLFRIEYDKLMTMPLDNDERAYQKMEKIAQIHKQIYEILFDFDSTKKPENNKKWSQLLDLFDIDIEHYQLINDRNDQFSEASAELQTRHFNVLKQLWGFVEDDGGSNKKGKKGSKEMGALIDLGVRRNHWVGKLLTSADSDQRKRKALMHFVNLEQIKTLFSFMNVRFKEKKYQFLEENAQADEFHDAAPEIHEEEEIARPSDESYHQAIDDIVQPATGETSNRWWDEVEQPQTAEAEEANNEQNPLADNKEDSAQLSDTASSVSSSRSKAQRARRKKKKQQQREAARNQVGAQQGSSSSASTMTPQRKSKGKEKTMNEEEQEWQKMVYFTAPNEKFDEKGLQKLTGEISFSEFLNDNFLQKHFVAFLLKNQNLLEWTEILTIGCYVNEIGKRIDAHREQYEGNPQKWIEIWEQDEMNGRLRQKIAYDREGLNTLENDYYRILRHIYNWNDQGIDDENADDLTMEKQLIKRQLLLTNLAKASLNFGAERAIREEQSAIRFLSMFYMPVEETEINNAELARIGWKRWREKKMFEQFEAEFLAPQKMLIEQKAIDANLLLNESKWRLGITTSPTNESDKIQIEADQTLLLSKRQMENETELTRALAMAVDFGAADQSKLQNSRFRLQEAIKGVEEIVTKIFAPKTTLQISGSHQLGTLTENSEVETILFASWRIKRKRFFGFNAECDSETRGCADTESLYCIFCKNQHVFNLRKSPKAMVPFISFTYCPHITFARMGQETTKLPPFQCVHFWMTFVTLRGYGAISRETLENARLLIENFKVDEQDDIYQIAWNDPRAGMIHALSGYQMNRDILAKLVNASMLRAYRIALLALIKWAKNHHIYAAVYGFLNDSTLALMLLKVLLKHPNHSAPYLLERFFFHYTKWPWPMPVQLAELSADNQSLTTDKTLGWRVEKEVHQKRNMLGSKVPMLTNDMLLSMPVIKPGLPEKNEAFTINHSTMAIIREEMERGLSKIHAILHQQQQPNKANWEQLLRLDKPFNMKYTHFIVLHCFAMDEQLSSEFCDNYVMPQLRLQLLYTVERQLGIRRCHVLPDVGKSKREISAKMRKILGTSKFGNSLLKQWLIGIQFVEGKGYNEQQKAAISKFHNEAQRGFVERFVQDHSNFLLRDKENAISRAKIAQIVSNVKLHVEIVEASEVFDWYSGKEVWIEKESHK